MTRNPAKPTLYPRNQDGHLTPKLFLNPTSEYRGTPFWAWNCELDWKILDHQIDAFKTMGLGGFHIHVRTGLVTPYMGEEFMRLVRASADKAAKEGMLCWLYDEDRWPSGYGGGFVTSEEKFRSKHLLWTCQPYGTTRLDPTNISIALGARNENGTLLGSYEVVLKDGCLAEYHHLKDGKPPSGRGVVWYAYIETAKPVPWFGNQTYVDTLNADATRRFIEVTHEVYAREVGEHFGKTIPAMFTDEPQFTRKTCFFEAESKQDLFFPFTTDLLETYAKAYWQRLEEHLPELFWELPDERASVVRYRYHDHVCERFASAYADVLGEWCGRHGIALTGHMMEEQTLLSQTSSLGEAMRSYRSFQIPGVDMLCDCQELTTAKQAQSAVHQYDREAMLSELYGVTGWQFDFVGHKGQGDWQAALGVTVRNQHLAWVSMAGEAKRDYPASIGYQSPWYKEYPVVEDHFARVNTALTRGRPVVRVGVIHPVESYWLCFGPTEQTAVERQEREKQFQEVTRWLLSGLVDFDFLCEALLPSLGGATEGKKLQVGAMAYDAVVVPSLRTIRSSTLDRLEAFAEAGGTVLWMGEVPCLVDAIPSERAMNLAHRCSKIPFSARALLKALEPHRELDLRVRDGGYPFGSCETDRVRGNFLHQIRQDGDTRYVFLCNTDRRTAQPGSRLRIKGEWAVTHLNTLTGQEEALAAKLNGAWTELTWDFPGCGSLLLQLAPASTSPGKKYHYASRTEIARLADPVPVTLSEPNVLLLDFAEWSVNDGAWQPETEILRLDNAVRKSLGLPDRTGDIAQPWVDQAPAPILGNVKIRFRIQSRVRLENCRLALENAAATEIAVNGNSVPNTVEGWWVDKAIQTVALPALDVGEHELVLSFPFTRKSEIEAGYLLGDFGVEVRGKHAMIIEPVTELAFGDWVHQGLPFYAGNVTYHCQVAGAESELVLRVPNFKNPLLTAELNGKRLEPLAYPPFEAKLGMLSSGSHKLDITAYGNRFNALGALHNCDPAWLWHGPGAWRTEGENWSDEYQFKPIGILSAPCILQSR